MGTEPQTGVRAGNVWVPDPGAGGAGLTVSARQLHSGSRGDKGTRGPGHAPLGEPLPPRSKQICPLRRGPWPGSWEPGPQQNACHSLDPSRRGCLGCRPRAAGTRPEDMGGECPRGWPCAVPSHVGPHAEAQMSAEGGDTCPRPVPLSSSLGGQCPPGRGRDSEPGRRLLRVAGVAAPWDRPCSRSQLLLSSGCFGTQCPLRCGCVPMSLAPQ